MAHQIPWNKIILEEFIRLAILSKDEEAVMRTRVAGWTRVEQAMKLGMSLAKVDKITAQPLYDPLPKCSDCCNGN